MTRRFLLWTGTAGAATSEAAPEIAALREEVAMLRRMVFQMEIDRRREKIASAQAQFLSFGNQRNSLDGRNHDRLASLNEIEELLARTGLPEEERRSLEESRASLAVAGAGELESERASLGERERALAGWLEQQMAELARLEQLARHDIGVKK